MEITITLTDLEFKVLAHEHEDVQEIIQNMISGNLRERIKRLAHQNYEPKIIDNEVVLNAVFEAEGYMNAAQKASAIAAKEAELAAIKDT